MLNRKKKEYRTFLDDIGLKRVLTPVIEIFREVLFLGIDHFYKSQVH